MLLSVTRRDGPAPVSLKRNHLSHVGLSTVLKHPTIAHRVQNYLSSDEPSLRSKPRAASHKPHSAHATQTSFSRMCFHVFISSATTINISKHTAPLTVTPHVTGQRYSCPAVMGLGAVSPPARHVCVAERRVYCTYCSSYDVWTRLSSPRLRLR